MKSKQSNPGVWDSAGVRHSDVEKDKIVEERTAV